MQHGPLKILAGARYLTLLTEEKLEPVDNDESEDLGRCHARPSDLDEDDRDSGPLMT